MIVGPGRVGLRLEDRHSLRRCNGQQRDFRRQAREHDETDGNRDAISIDSNPLLRIPSKLIASRFPTPSRLFHCSFLSCSEKTAPEEQAGAARSTDRRETRGMSLICQCTIRSGVLNRECPWMRPVLQSGHGVAAARQGIGRATRTGPSDGSRVVAGWKKGRSEFLILTMSSFLLPDQHGDRRPPLHRQQPWRCEGRG